MCLFLFINCILSVILIDAFGDIKHTSDQTLVYKLHTACSTTHRWANCSWCFYPPLIVRLLISACWAVQQTRVIWWPAKNFPSIQEPCRLSSPYFPVSSLPLNPVAIFLYLLSLLPHLLPLFPAFLKSCS